MNSVHVVVLSGAIDASSLDQLRQIVEPLLALPQPKVLLDCLALAYINSTGYGVFFTWGRTAEGSQGQFAVCSLARKITNLMKVLGLEKFVTAYSSRETALAAMEGTPSA